ncbi:MAG: hypothetical protein CM15mP49_22220 [Actinomycetota bacterium]|nr:MAG: hypothetical protein CM15mP49_22220 [Actinomycetota bacterium]
MGLAFTTTPEGMDFEPAFEFKSEPIPELARGKF